MIHIFNLSVCKLFSTTLYDVKDTSIENLAERK